MNNRPNNNFLAVYGVQDQETVFNKKPGIRACRMNTAASWMECQERSSLEDIPAKSFGSSFRVLLNLLNSRIHLIKRSP